MYSLKELKIWFLKCIGYRAKSVCFNCRHEIYVDGKKCIKHYAIAEDYISGNDNVIYAYCVKHNKNGNCPLFCEEIR